MWRQTKPAKGTPDQVRPQTRLAKNLIDRSIAISLSLSILTILLVQLASLFFHIYLTAVDINRQSQILADEMSIILQQPLYNIEDAQVVRIAEALLVSGRIAGISIFSTATGLVYEKESSHSSQWIPPQTRKIEFRNIELGTVTIEYSDQDFMITVRLFGYVTLALIIAVLLSNTVVTSVFLLKKIKRVFATIEVGIHEIRAGNYDYSIASSGYRDMDAIINQLNSMGRDIQDKRLALLDLNAKLESRVAQRTADLEAALAEQRLLQEQLVESGKLSVVGQLAAGLAHEFNTPLGAIISSNNLLIGFFDETFPLLTEFSIQLTETERALYQKLLELGFEENRIISLPLYSRSQRWEAVDYLTNAGIVDAKRIVESLADMYLLDKIDQLLPFFSSDQSLRLLETVSKAVIARRMVEIINEAGRKASNVVSALQSYLTADTKDKPAVDLNKVLKRVLSLMHNMFTQGVEVRTDLFPGSVFCLADKLDQVLFNLIRNAVQAMDFQGTLSLQTGVQNDKAWVSVTDTGSGIAEAIQDRIFEPFFTTRQHGSGMGLGLDICRRIIEQSDGSLVFKSRPGETIFTIELPLYKLETNLEKEL